MIPKLTQRPDGLPFAIGLFLFSIYLLSFSGRFHVMDELAVFATGHNLALHGRADINQLIWTNHWTPNPPGVWGDDGNLYTKKPPGISFVTAPLIGLGYAVPRLNVVHVGLLTNSLVTALTAALLFIWLLDLDFSRPAALLTSLGYGLCTIAWVYARMFWESSLLALAFTLAVWSIFRASYLVSGRGGWPWLLLCGAAVGVGLSLRFEAALMILLIGLFLLANRHTSGAARAQPGEPLNEAVTNDRPQPPGPVSEVLLLLRSFVIFLTPSLIVGLGLLYYNFIRYGSLAETGYTQEILFHKPWEGAFGLLFSPGRGLLIYAPLVLLAVFGIRPAWRRLPRPYFWLIVATCVGYWLFYGSWFAWGGTWGWGPRFLLPVLPLLMLFVAEPVEWLCCQTKPGLRSGLVWLGVGILALASLVVNLLGIMVDFNQHFLRLGSNDDFVFNWATFPPLAHWQLLREGLVDVIWLRPQAGGLRIEWPVLLPALLLFLFAAASLIVVYQSQRGLSREMTGQAKDGTLRRAPGLRLAATVFALGVALSLTYLMMRGTARISLTDRQAQADRPVLDSLDTSAHAGDALLVPMPAFGDVQEISTRLMAYLEPALPIYAWIESGERAIHPDEREQVWRAVQADAQRVWLFERWLTPDESPGNTAHLLNQQAFPVWEQWFPESGKLTLYTLASPSQPGSGAVSLGIPFVGGLILEDFSVWNQGLPLKSGDTLMLRLTWQANVSDVPPQDIPAGRIIASTQLLDQTPPADIIAQNDRLLVDVPNLDRSPLRPGQTIQQGYGLQLPDDLAPGSYSLIVGLYDAANGQRLGRADGSPDDFVFLSNIQVK